MGTYATIQARVNRRVIDLPTQVQAEVPQLINEALQEVQSRHNFKVMETELAAYTAVGSQTLVASVGGAALAVPSNFKEFNGEPYWVRYQDGSIRFMTVAPDRYSIWGAFSEGANADQSFPQILLDAPGNDLNVRNYQVYPLPDGASDYPDGEYRITIPYFRYLPQLVSDGDTNVFTIDPMGERFLVEWATSEAFALDWDQGHEQEHKQKAELQYRLLVQQDKRYRVSAVNEMASHWRGVHNTRTRL